MDRKRIRSLLVFGLLLLLATGFIGSQLTAQGTEQVIRITAQKFVYSPRDIKLKKGQPVTFEFASRDVMHGFNCLIWGYAPISFPEKLRRSESLSVTLAHSPFTATIFVGAAMNK